MVDMGIIISHNPFFTMHTEATMHSHVIKNPGRTKIAGRKTRENETKNMRMFDRI